MNVDVILAQVLQLAASLDGAIEAGVPCEEDHVYALAGLVMELDGWLATGRRPPSAGRAAPSDGALLVLGADAASNEVTPRRRHGPVRRRRAAVATTQLALPFLASV